MIREGDMDKNVMEVGSCAVHTSPDRGRVPQAPEHGAGATRGPGHPDCQEHPHRPSPGLGHLS